MYLSAFDPAAVRASPAAIAFYQKYGDDGIGRQLGGGEQEGEGGDVGAAPPTYEEATASVAD